ncbi:N-terminal nucleophile aminohydrolase [Exidia glandulosa HHB12029]|uniref:N-terminal nucleophile aminohydrolase n=1 Tax=Exidia glandulosa HHB12029 TaxID=1314781 RepID=A0A165EII2_EXIGL|nr:N-terminal nucleophile aminohydrolase [Exidia glandulosa HHB12029]
MCRWFAYISDSEPALLEDVLVRPAHGLTKQVNDHFLPKLFHHEEGISDDAQRAEIKQRNILYNEDGTGVAFYSGIREEYGEATGPRPQLYKTIQPPQNDINFKSLVMHSSSTCVFAHIRMATSAVHEFNNHPFAFGRHIFMHNGTVTEFMRIRREMSALMTPAAFENIQGSTDSEHVAALYFTYLAPDDNWERTYSVQEMKRALDKTISTVLQLQKKLPGEVEANSLNLCTSDGERLLAVRFRNHATQQPPSLYFSTVAGVTLNRKYPGHPDLAAHEQPQADPAPKAAKEHGNHVIIASEPTTYNENEWNLIREWRFDAHCIKLIAVNAFSQEYRCHGRREYAGHTGTGECLGVRVLCRPPRVVGERTLPWSGPFLVRSESLDICATRGTP